jgi:hypothetical protein
LFHAVQHAVWEGNRPRADSLFQRFANATPSTNDEYHQLELMRGCLDGTSTAERWSEAARRSVSSAAQAATWLTVGGLRLEGCAREGLEAVVANPKADWQWHRYAMIELAAIHSALDDIAEVGRLLPQLGTHADVLTIFLATSGLPIGDLADAALNRIRQLPESTASSVSWWAAGTWLIERRDTAAVRAVLGVLTRSDHGPSRLSQLLAESLRARLTLLRGDTAAAITALSRLRPITVQATLR